MSHQINVKKTSVCIVNILFRAMVNYGVYRIPLTPAPPNSATTLQVSAARKKSALRHPIFQPPPPNFSPHSAEAVTKQESIKKTIMP